MRFPKQGLPGSEGGGGAQGGYIMDLGIRWQQLVSAAAKDL